MKFKHRIEGKVCNSFILRGLHFAVGDSINFDVADSELEFIKSHCNLNSIVDLSKKTSPSPVLEETKPKGENEDVELHKSNTSRKPKVKISG